MKKSIGIAMLLLTAISAYSQEIVIDSINTNNFNGFYRSGPAGEMLSIPYFKSNQKSGQNFVIKSVNTMDLNEIPPVLLELPQSYNLVSSASGMEGGLLVFYDKAENNYALLIIKENNVVKKKTIKASGNSIKAINGQAPETYVIIEIGKKGDYTLYTYNNQLEEINKKSYSPASGTTWKIVSMETNMEGLQILRKETAKDGKYTFKMIGIATEGLDEAYSQALTVNNINTYPTFITENEGIAMSGGVYYRNGVDKDQNPDGLYVATMTPNGEVEQAMEVPYSQVIEDLKTELGDKLSKKHTGIILTGATISHDLQRYLLAGEVFTRTDNPNGGSTFTTEDIVILGFNFEGKYLGAERIAVPLKKATVKGDVSGISDMDLAVWMNKSGFGSFQSFFNTPVLPSAVYLVTNTNQPNKICMQQTGTLRKELHKACMDIPLAEGNITYTYDYTATAAPVYNFSKLNVLPNKMNMENISYYKIGDNRISILNMPAPSMEEFMDEETEQLVMKILEEEMNGHEEIADDPEESPGE